MSKRTNSRTCSKDPAPTIRQREVLSRVNATFTLAELQESACHRYEGHTRRMVDSMVARGAVEAVGGDRYRKTECAVPQCAREGLTPKRKKGRKRAKASKPARAKKPSAATAPSVPLDRPGIYAVDSKGRVSTVIEGARSFDGSAIADILAVIDRRGPWTVYVVRPGRGRRKQIESITGDELLEAARREGKQIERAVLFTNREFVLSTEDDLRPADATEPSRPVQFKDYERVDDRLYVGPQRALALAKTRKGWVVLRRGLHDRLWRIVDGPMKWNKARSAAGVAAAQALPVPPALGAPRPLPAGDASELDKVGLAARAKAVTLLAVADLFMAVGDSIDLSPWARAPLAPTMTASGWTAWGRPASAAVLGCIVGRSAEENFEAPEERRDRFDTEWLTHAFRRYRWDLGPLTRGTWVAEGEVDGQPRTIQLRIIEDGVLWGTLGREPNMGPYTLASNLLESVVRVLRLQEREPPGEIAGEQPVDLLALTDRPEVVRPLLDKASKWARAFLERVVQASPRAAMISTLVELLGVKPKQIGGITAEIYQLAERHGLAPPLVAKMFDGERGWRWAGWQVTTPKPAQTSAAAGVQRGAQSKTRAAEKPVRPKPKVQREPTEVRIRRRDGGHRWALLHQGRPVSWLTYRKHPAKNEQEAESAARRDLKERKRRGVVNGRSVLAPNITPWKKDDWSVALLPAETAMPDSVFASYYRKLSGDMAEVRAFIERRKAAGVDLVALGVEIPAGWDTPTVAAAGAPTHVLIGCVKAKKASGRHRAGELYEGALWDLRRAYADARMLPWAIVSAAHGVIGPDERIKPYDQQMRDHTPERRRVWQSTTQRQLAAVVGRGAVVEVLAGKAYIEALQVPARALGITLVAPAAGKGIGARKKWLADRVAELGGWVPTREAVQAEVRQHWSREGRPPEYYSPDRRVRFSTFGGRTYRVESLRGAKWVRHGADHKSYAGAARAAVELHRANRDDAATVDPPGGPKASPSGQHDKPPLRGRPASGAKRDGTATVEPAKGRKGRNRGSKGAASTPPLQGRPASPSRGGAKRDDPATVPCLPFGAVDVGDAPAELADTARLAWQIRQAAAKLGRPTRGVWVVCGTEVYPIGALPEGIDPAVPAVFVDVGAGGVDQVEQDDGFMLAVQTADQALRRHRLRLTEDERASLLRALRFARGDSTKAYDRHLIKTLAAAGFRRTGQLAGGKEVWTDGTGAMSWAVRRGAPNSEVLDAFFEEMARHLTRDMASEIRQRAQQVLGRAFRMARRRRSVRPKGFDRSAGGAAPNAAKASAPAKASKPSASPKASRRPGWRKGATGPTIERAEDADAVGLLRPGSRVKVTRQGEGTLRWWVKLAGGRVRGLVAFEDGESFVDQDKIKAVAPAPAGAAGSDGHPNPGGHAIVLRTTLGANGRRKGKVRYATFSPQGGGSSGDAKTMGSAVGRALVDAGLWQTGEPVVIRYEQTGASGEVKAQQWTTDTSSPKNAWGKPFKLGHMPAKAAGTTKAAMPKASKPKPASPPERADSGSEAPAFTITPATHTKKGHPIWVVQLHGPRLPKDRFAELKALAKRVAVAVAGDVRSGYYSSYRKGGALPGFIFASAPEAEAFVDAADGRPTPAPAPAPARSPWDAMVAALKVDLALHRMGRPFARLGRDKRRSITWGGSGEGLTVSESSSGQATVEVRRRVDHELIRVSFAVTVGERGARTILHRFHREGPDVTAPSAGLRGVYAERWATFVEKLPEDARRWLALLEERGVLTASDAEATLGADRRQTSAYIAHINAWAAPSGVALPYAERPDGAWLWAGARPDWHPGDAKAARERQAAAAAAELPAKASQLPGWDRRKDPANGRVTYRSPSRQVTVGFGHGDGYDVMRRDGSTWRVASSHDSWGAAAKAALRVERALPAIDVVLIEQGRWPHKLGRSTPITRVFRGQQWDARRQYAKRLGAEVVVVSGLGLLMSSYSARPGEVRPALNKGFDADTRRQLARSLPDMLRAYARGGHRLRLHVFCADPLGAELVDAAERAGIETQRPTKGMGVGDEVRWLASQHAPQPTDAAAAPQASPAPFSPPAELDKPGPRTKANLRAVQIAHALRRSGRTATDAERAEMLRYSGWGGLSIAKVEKDWPDGIPLPNKRALVHEFYTPWAVCADITAAAHRLVSPESARAGVQALEPSAGIGRFVHTARFPGWRWTAAELSPLSALILEETLPDVDVHVGSFESWVQAHGDRRFDVIVSNPPYGPRGETIVDDKDRRFRVKAAYQYFILRCLTLLRPGGVAAFLVPGGFMTGSSAQKIRRRVAESAELVAAFRLPDGTFPGARLSLDVVFLRARAGAVDDPVFVDGQYFNETPQHILGEIKPTGRWGDPEVIGEYAGLPAFEPRQAGGRSDGSPPASAEAGAGEGGPAPSAFVPLYDLSQAAERTENYGKKLQPREAPLYEKTVWWWAVRDVVDNDRPKKDREAMLREALEALRGAANKAARWEQNGGHSVDRMTRDEARDLLIGLRRGRDTIKEGLQALGAQRGRRREKDVAHEAEGFTAVAASLAPVYEALAAAHRWSTVVVPKSVLDLDQLAALVEHHAIQLVAGSPREHHIRLTDKSRRYFAEHPPRPQPGRAAVAAAPTPASPPTLVDEMPRGLVGEAMHALDWSTPEEAFTELQAKGISPQHIARAIALAYAHKNGRADIDLEGFADDLRARMARVIDVEPVVPAGAPDVEPFVPAGAPSGSDLIPDNVIGLFAVRGQDLITISDARFMGGTLYTRKPRVETINTDGAAQMIAARGGRWRLVLRLTDGSNWREASYRDWPDFPEELAKAMKAAAALHGAELGEMVVERAGDGPFEHATPAQLPHPALPPLPADAPRTTLTHALERLPRFMDEGFAHTAWRHKQRLIAVRRISMVTWNLPDGVAQWYGKDGKPWHDPELQTTGEWKISLQSGVVRLLRQYDEACAGSGGELPTKTLRAAVRAAPTVEWDNVGKTETEKRLLLVVRNSQLFAEDFEDASKQVHLCAFDGPDCAIAYPAKQIRAALAKAPATIRLCVPDHAQIDEARLLRGSVLMIDRGDGERHYISALNMTAALLDDLAARPVVAAVPTKPKASPTTAATVPRSKPKASPTAATAPKPKASTTAAAVPSPSRSKRAAPALPTGATKVSKKAAAVLETVTAGMHAETADAIVWRRIGEKGGAIMPLSVERLYPGRFALAHYFEQNGDLVPDPDVEFIRVEKGVWVPVTYQDQRKYGRYEEDGVITDPRAQRDLATFVSKTWMPNVREQHLVRGELPDHQITRANGTEERLQTDASRAAQAAEKLPAAYRDLEMEGPRPTRPSTGKRSGLAAGLKAVEMERRRVPLTAAIERARFFADPGDPVLAALGIADGLLVASDGKHLVEIAVDDDGPRRAVNAAGTEVDVAYPPADQIVEAADPVATVAGDLGKVDRALRKLTCDPVEIELRAHEVIIGGQRMPGLRIEDGSISGTWCLSLHRIRPALIGAKKGRILLGAPTAPIVVERGDGEHHRIRAADAPCAVCPPPAPIPAVDELPREPLPAPARGPSEKVLARLLSERVGAYHAADVQRRALMYPELAAALDVFEATFNRRLASIERPDVAPPVVRDDAEVRALLALHPAGVPAGRVADVDELLQRGWRLDGDRLLPRADYLSGNLWARLSRLEAVPGRFQRAVELQRRELEEAIGVVDYHQVADRMSLRDGWLPPRVIGAFLGSFRRDKTPVGLERREGLLQIRKPRDGEREVTYEQIQAYANTSSIRLIIGYINHDEQVFKPSVSRRTGEKIHDKRRKLAEKYERSFRAFVETRPDLQELIADAYRATHRGFVPRTYSGAPLQLARWGSAITPHPHQNAGARRAVDQRGMVAAYGVGVGKTFTACATVALARQRGTRRPVILVPNSLVSKWQRDIQKALPDFAVVTIGEKSTKGRDGALRFGPDTKADREAKWARFSDGLYDLALVTPSAFLRTQITPDEFEALAEGATELQRMVRLAQRNARSRTNPSERQQAVLEQGVRAFLAEMMELPESWARDDVRWSELGVDLLIVDEAQNYKGLHSPELRQGTVPRFMGQTQPSKRAWNLDARARDVRGRGGFVVLLSATPAKNSPLELYNLWSYVNGELWRDHGIHDPESFISRFLQIEPRLVINAQMEAAERPAVTAFKNLDELKAILLRWGEFIQPPDIGLVVPEPTTELVEVDMDAAQEAKYERYVVKIEQALDAMSRGEGNSNAVLGLLARMGLVAVHAELDRGLKYRTAGKAAVQPSSPKFEAIADYVLSNQTCGHIVFVQATAAHRWLKDTLVARGIAKERIGVLNAEVAKSSDARQRVADRFNDGKLDVVIANSIAYEGLDLQVRTCAIHHADLPWEPATLNQRNGRAVRQGNTLQTVAIRYYFSRRSMDGLRFNLIQGKQGWMGALLEGSDAIANPGADLELGPDEILLLISRTPEETQARLDKLRAAAEAKRRLEERERAESMLRAGTGLMTNARVAAMKGDDERRARLQAEGNQLLDAVEQIDPDIWPWRWLLRAARDAGAGEILARVARPPLFPGCWLRHQGGWRQVGRTLYVKRKQHLALRAPGRATWNHVNVDELRDFEAADVVLDRPSDLVDDWHADAKRHAELTMKDAHRGWRVTGWAYAAPAWLDEAWTRFGGLVEESIRGLSPQLWKSSWGPDQTFFPFDLAGEVYLQTEGGPPPAGATLLPPTAEGFERWLQLAVPDAFRKLTLRDEATRWWWGRPLPRGLQRKVVKDNPSNPRGSMRSIDLRNVSADSHVVIGLGPDDRVAWVEGVKGARDAQRAQKRVPAELPVALIVRVDNVAQASGGRRRPTAPTYVAQTDRLQDGAGVLLVADAGGQLCQVRPARHLRHAYELVSHVDTTYPRVIIGEVRHRYSQSA